MGLGGGIRMGGRMGCGSRCRDKNGWENGLREWVEGSGWM